MAFGRTITGTAHCSTFIVECDAATWTNAGLVELAEDESRR
jgi:hypothetical protein